MESSQHRRRKIPHKPKNSNASKTERADEELYLLKNLINELEKVVYSNNIPVHGIHELHCLLLLYMFLVLRRYIEDLVDLARETHECGVLIYVCN